MIWSIPDLSPSAVPQLKDNEKIIEHVNDVGLYNNEAKCVDHANGIIYLTSERLVYVDSLHPVTNSVQADLVQISDIAYTPKFLKSSAKITIEFSEKTADKSKELANGKTQNWACTICSFLNSHSSDICEACGVRAQEDTAVYMAYVGTSQGSGICPQCTFKNHKSLKFCEMCGASLFETVLPSTLGSRIKISFRRGRSHAFWEELYRLFQTITSESSKNKKNPVSIPADNRNKASGESNSNDHVISNGQFGIRSLRAKNQQVHNESLAVLNKAMQSVDGFKANLFDVITIAEKLGAPLKLPIIPGVEGNASEQLARQLADLLIGKDNILILAGGMLTLHDTYALFNRCRGLGTVSPQQLWNALQLCETLDLPLRVRTLSSGLKVLESRGGLDQALQRLVHWITVEFRQTLWRESSGFSARDVSEHFGCSVQIAVEELVLAEERGKLCRDEHISGLRFFPNLFLTNGIVNKVKKK